jgi:hypothetical protein
MSDAQNIGKTIDTIREEIVDSISAILHNYELERTALKRVKRHYGAGSISGVRSGEDEDGNVTLLFFINSNGEHYEDPAERISTDDLLTVLLFLEKENSID